MSSTASVAKNLISKVKLNDGVEMPLFGLGVYLIKDNCEHLIHAALDKGYRLLDTAELYHNEAGVGDGLKKSGLAREDVFIVSKWFPSNEGAEGAKKALSTCLKNLKSDYVDLYLLHAPQGGKCAEAYRALLDCKKNKQIRSLGVSNFGVHHLEAMEKLGLEAPSVNQIELHPWQQKTDIVDYCRKKGIAVMGYSPLAKGNKVKDETVRKIAQKLNKTPGQVLIRWSVQHGFITIPKTSNESRLEENADVFNWTIPDEDMNILVMNT
ncbi:unnamed protein product [Didymodactylos carnosus]|uniref:NADP-dependent oxidoreductase domain-containing protein n=1 Tax=Didymodactylos carnosus TaxID=1234261 RepID=A0A815SPN2_9BILA|nr:unnamed protein product [Didymodactylos carnosus]CAF1492582.1 unnamed protein product [Didymodactylos carnosus]CAF3697273.1 unnamed protein product [Didymodactylos carnosus]CAF4355452.1 unnamed protein product [Didymodactylos carnosus]